MGKGRLPTKVNSNMMGFPFSAVASAHSELFHSEFYGTMTMRYEQGRIVLMKFEQTVKPLSRVHAMTIPAVECEGVAE